MLRLTHDHDDMTTMITPTTKGWRCDDSTILPGWSVTLVGPCQYPRYTSAVKDGRPRVAQATDKAAKHHKNTTGTRSESNGERDRAMCFQIVQVWLLLSRCGCVRNTAETVAKHERTAAEPETLTYRCLRSRNRLLKR